MSNQCSNDCPLSHTLPHTFYHACIEASLVGMNVHEEELMKSAFSPIEMIAE